MSSWDTNPWSNFCDLHWDLISRNKWHPGTSEISAPLEIAVRTQFHARHDTKTTPADREAFWSLLSSSVSCQAIQCNQKAPIPVSSWWQVKSEKAKKGSNIYINHSYHQPWSPRVSLNWSLIQIQPQSNPIQVSTARTNLKIKFKNLYWLTSDSKNKKFSLLAPRKLWGCWVYWISFKNVLSISTDQLLKIHFKNALNTCFIIISALEGYVLPLLDYYKAGLHMCAFLSKLENESCEAMKRVAREAYKNIKCLYPFRK